MSQDEKHPFRDDEKHPFGNDKKKFESEDALNSAPADQPPSYDDVVNEDMKYQQQQQQQQQQQPVPVQQQRLGQQQAQGQGSDQTPNFTNASYLNPDHAAAYEQYFNGVNSQHGQF